MRLVCRLPDEPIEQRVRDIVSLIMAFAASLPEPESRSDTFWLFNSQNHLKPDGVLIPNGRIS